MSRISTPFSRIRPCVGSWNRATRSVTVVFPAPLRPTSATTDPPGAVRLNSWTTGIPGRYSNATSSNVSSRTRAGASRASGRSGLSRSMPRTSKTRSMAASERCISENELTMLQTGFSRRNMYHWNAMMSPTDATHDAQVAAEPDDHHADAGFQQPPRRPEPQLPAVRKQLFAQYRVAAQHEADQ